MSELKYWSIFFLSRKKLNNKYICSGARNVKVEKHKKKHLKSNENFHFSSPKPPVSLNPVRPRRDEDWHWRHRHNLIGQILRLKFSTEPCLHSHIQNAKNTHPPRQAKEELQKRQRTRKDN